MSDPELDAMTWAICPHAKQWMDKIVSAGLPTCQQCPAVETVDGHEGVRMCRAVAVDAARSARAASGTAAERDALKAALARLVAAKAEKDTNGETPRYHELKQGAWERARETLARYEKPTAI